MAALSGRISIIVMIVVADEGYWLNVLSESGS